LPGAGEDLVALGLQEALRRRNLSADIISSLVLSQTLASPDRAGHPQLTRVFCGNSALRFASEAAPSSDAREFGWRCAALVITARGSFTTRFFWYAFTLEYNIWWQSQIPSPLLFPSPSKLGEGLGVR